MPTTWVPPLAPTIERALRSGELPDDFDFEADAAEWDAVLVKRRRDVFRLRWFAGSVFGVFFCLHLYLLATGSGRTWEVYGGTVFFAVLFVIAVLQPVRMVPKIDALRAKLDQRRTSRVD